MKKIFLVIGLLLVSTLLVSCSTSEDSDLKQLGFSGLSSKEILELLANDDIDTSNYSVSVDDEYLWITTKSNVIKLDMPEDEFYLSVAPYINYTHECVYHSATGCQGELDGKEFYVFIKDSFGNVLIDGVYNSMHNGFIDLWLPKNINAVMTITFNNLTVEKEISTYSGNKTCETTARLT